MKPERIDAALLSALADFDEAGEAGLRVHARSLGVHGAMGRPRPATAVVFLHCDPSERFENLRQLGVEVNQSQGHIRTASVPLTALGTLSEQDGVRRIIGARYLKPLLDVAKPHVHVPQFVNRTGLTGRGVIIGVIDSGIDASHPSFAGRILRIWDQAAVGAGVPGASYGSELTGTQLVASRDTDGHGTHVAGIAAGDDPVFAGVAPEADVIVVKTDFQDVHIADAVQYVFRIAAELQRPAVVNLSLGGHSDAHDGTDSLSQIIDSESGPGRIVCCAAGNEGNDNIHARAAVAPGRLQTMRFRVPPSTVGLGVLNGWYALSATLDIAVRSPGRYVTPFQAVRGSASPTMSYTLPDARVRISTPGPDPANGDHSFLIELRGPALGSPVAAGVWQLLARSTAGTTTLDVWTFDDTGASSMTFSGKSVVDSMKIGSPGSAAEAVTVVAFTTRVSWVDINGAPHTAGLPLNDVSDFSSEGPLRNLAQKPEVTAPGAMIISAVSNHSSPRVADQVSSTAVVLAGTSMATPFIAGLVALLLQRDPFLDPTQVKAMLKSASSIPGLASGTFDPKWGFGLIDANRL